MPWFSRDLPPRKKNPVLRRVLVGVSTAPAFLTVGRVIRFVLAFVNLVVAVKFGQQLEAYDAITSSGK